MPATMTDGGSPIRCEICGASSVVDVSRPPGDSVCPVCGSFLWVDAIVEFASEIGFVPDVRISQLCVFSREDAFHWILADLGRECGWSDDQRLQLLQALLNRERLGTTGIGRGVAIPHAWVDWVDRPCTALAYLPVEIPFDSVDGRPVHTVALMAGPKHRKADGLRMIQRIARSLRPIGSS